MGTTSTARTNTPSTRPSTPALQALSSTNSESNNTETDISSPGSVLLDDAELSSGISVYLPDLFSSIMSVDLVVNPNYEEVKAQADAWVVKVLNLDEKMARRNSKADFAYLSSVWVPHADATGLRLMTDWNHWVFVYDDQFDEGHLKADPFKAAEEIISTLAILDDTHPPISMEEDPIKHIFQATWLSFKEKSSPDMQARFKRLHRKYMLGCLKQVHWMSGGYPNLDIDQYMDYRRGSVGTYPAFPVIECANGIDLPRNVMEHPSIVTCEAVITDIVILGNDLLSMRKDLEYGVEHNIVTRLRGLGLTMQEAVDRVSVMMDDCYRRWYGALAELPVWGYSIDRQVLKLLNGYRDLAMGTLYWRCVLSRGSRALENQGWSQFELQDADAQLIVSNQEDISAMMGQQYARHGFYTYPSAESPLLKSM